MERNVIEKRNDNYITISLLYSGNSFRLVSSIDTIIDYDMLLRCDEKEAVECFKNLQIKYFNKIIDSENFEVTDVV
jgi:hypothetical protein